MHTKHATCLCNQHLAFASHWALVLPRPAALPFEVTNLQQTQPTVFSFDHACVLSFPFKRDKDFRIKRRAMACPPVAICAGGSAADCSPPSTPPPSLRLENQGSNLGARFPRSLSSHDVKCLGFVGQGARPAGQYFECDFDWHEHAHAAQPLVEAQEAKALARIRQISVSLQPRKLQDVNLGTRTVQFQESHRQAQHGADVSPGRGESAVAPVTVAAVAAVSPSTLLRQKSHSQESAKITDICLPNQPASFPFNHGIVGRQFPMQPSFEDGSTAIVHGTDITTDTITTILTTTATINNASSSCSTTAPSLPSSSSVPLAGVYEGRRWEDFYRCHPSARFFKERRYLLLEFPELLRCSHVAEIGCGCGSSILPVLKSNPSARTTCTDISTTCLQQLRDAAAAEGIAQSRIAVFPADATDPAATPLFDGIEADALLIMFTLSAVMPPQQQVMLSHAWRALRPGGRLYIRDHGLYDMVQLRIPPEQWIGPNLYKRGDGTMAYFFSTEDLALRAMAARLDVVECKYVTVINRNRKTGIELRRVFVHGVFEKPMANESR